MVRGAFFAECFRRFVSLRFGGNIVHPFRNLALVDFVHHIILLSVFLEPYRIARNESSEKNSKNELHSKK